MRLFLVGNRRLEPGAGLEGRHGSGGNGQGLAGLGVAARACLTLAGLEGTKADQGDKQHCQQQRALRRGHRPAGLKNRARGIGGAEKLLKVVCGEAKKRGINNFSIHARTLNGFADKVKKIFDGNINLVRNIKRWKYGGNEVYEYIEWDF